MQPLQLSQLPEELLVKILGLSVASDRERAELAMVCKTWRQVVNTNWTSVCLHARKWTEMEAQITWLNTVVKQSSPSIHKISIVYRSGDDMKHVEYHTTIASSTLRGEPNTVKNDYHK